ncbi:protein phosphatase 2C-like domain-containing protein 1 [Cricetulus griseus]|uniref:Protein phosphatase 2C-like domain-containing protein 1 n=1 Tax=Cricetulus griseus TaxID=10029 RepID=A0A9J7HBU3_CRIGR|nr:protein phosphatase 2C-like domain-containing protein 1 [Cricetulus griseus]XP_035310480.1 protein phosphatase 2C-like domain-containing protein 1 [Cricetulus griseus]
MFSGKELGVFWSSKEWDSQPRIYASDESLTKFGKKDVKKGKPGKSRTPNDHEKLINGQKVTFPCSVCKQEIKLAGTFLHKKHHNALSTLGFQWMGGKKPKPSMVSIQRQFVISNLVASFMFSENVLQSMNYAFELLWKKQVPSNFRLCDKVGQTSTHSPKICHLLIKGVAICGNSNSTWKADPNGKFTVTNAFGDKANVCFFGLFDGHHGDAAADLASKEFQVLLLHQLAKQDPSYHMTAEQQKLINSFHTVFKEEYRAREDAFNSTIKTFRTNRREYEEIHKAFAKAFWRMDRLLRLGRNEVSRVRWSGCSALTCVLEGVIKNPNISKDWAKTDPSQRNQQVISGVLHIANAGNVQAILCRNGKGFCLTKEHTTRNTKERRRVLRTGAVISSNGLLEGHIKTTRGLGFHGSLTLKKSIIPAPQTISVPIDDLCQFLILATNGLWEVLDKKEVTALVITLFHAYKEMCSGPENKSRPSKEPFSLSDSNIRVLFQYKPEYEEDVSTTNLTKRSSDSVFSQACINQAKNAETFPPEMTNYDTHSKKETNSPRTIDSKTGSEKELYAKNFYEGAAEYIGHELVRAALEGGSRESITVMVVFLNGSEYQLLT